MLTKFEDLCCDIIIELLSYFNVHEIFYSFCLLIPRLPALLADGHVPLHVRSNNFYFIRWILPHIKLKEVASLHLPTRPYNPSIFSFIALRSLVVHDLDNPLLIFENNNNGWPPQNLEHLSLYIRNQDIRNNSLNIGTRVLQCAFQLKQLRHFELHESKSSFKMVGLFDELDFPSTFQSTNIQCLILTIYCTGHTMQSILKYAPYLRKLKSRSGFSYSENISSQFHFPLVHKLDLRLDGLQTNLFCSIFRNSPCLRRCSLLCSFSSFKTDHIDLLTSDTWIQMIDIYTPQLQMLNVYLSFYLDNFDETAIEMVNEDFKILNFKLEHESDNGKLGWKITGTFIRNQNIVHD